MTSAGKNIAIGLALAIFVLVMDQVIKWAVEANLPYGQPVNVFPFFSLFYTFNTGIAFSLLNNLSATALLAIAAAVVVLMLYLWWGAREDGLLSSLGYGMIFGGAVGNMIDRGVHGHVIDYVLLHTEHYSFAIFNLADAALTVGVGFIILAGFLAYRREKKTETLSD